MQPQIKNHLIFFIDAPKIAYKNNEDIVHSRKKGGGGNLYHSFRKKKKKMRRKPELSDSTLRWKGTEPTASTVKKKKTENDLPKMSVKLQRWLEAALSFYTILHNSCVTVQHEYHLKKKKYSHFARLKEMHLHTRRDHETN